MDNVEHIFLPSLQAGTYDLMVKRVNNAVSGDENYALAFNFAPLPSPTVFSRKVHENVGTFNIPLPLTGSPGIECRRGTVSGEHQLVFTFPGSVSLNKVELTTGTGGVASYTATSTGSGTTEVTVNLSGVTNAQTVAITLFGVNDGTNMTDFTVQMGVLLGDVTGSRLVDSGDLTVIQSNSLQYPNENNFRADVNASGLINSGDITVVQGQSLTSL